MITAICINDGYRPKEIPKGKWLQQGQEYTVIRIARMAKMSNILGCQIMEIDLDETTQPFEFFRLDRFAFDKKDLEALRELIEMPDERIELEELLKEQLVEID